jgi:MFS family permease
MIPLAIGMIRDTFPREKVTTAIGIVSAMMGVGGTIGMLITGVIANHTRSPHPVFWTSVVLAVIGAVLVGISAHDSGTRIGGRPDFVGAALLAAWLVCLLLAISQGNDWGWASGGVAGLFAAAAVLCAIWVTVELKVREPLVRLGLLVGPRSLSANLASMLLGFSMFAAFTLVSNFVQTPKHSVGYGLSGSVLDVGLYGIPSTIAMMLFSALAGRIERRVGAAFTLAMGSGVAGVGYLWMAVSNGHVYDVIAFNVIQGIGFGIAYAALGTLAVQHVPMSQSGIASGINSLVRTTGGSVAGAITAAILTANTIGHSAVPSLHGYVLCFAVLTAGAWLSAAVAVANGVRHRS